MMLIPYPSPFFCNLYILQPLHTLQCGARKLGINDLTSIYLMMKLHPIHCMHCLHLQAFSPHYLVIWIFKDKAQHWNQIVSTVLCVSGAETMFNSMGHFSQVSVALTFTLFVYPCLVISYMGQGAFLLECSSDNSCGGDNQSGSEEYLVYGTNTRVSRSFRHLWCEHYIMCGYSILYVSFAFGFG